jgi:hypothetical protein
MDNPGRDRLLSYDPGGGHTDQLRDLSLALSKGLAGAILDEAALTPRGSCWAAL